MFGIKELKEKMERIELINTDVLQKLLEQKKENERLNAKLNELERVNAFLLMEKINASIDEIIADIKSEEKKQEEKTAPKKKSQPIKKATTTKIKKGDK